MHVIVKISKECPDRETAIALVTTVEKALENINAVVIDANFHESYSRKVKPNEPT